MDHDEVPETAVENEEQQTQVTRGVEAHGGSHDAEVTKATSSIQDANYPKNNSRALSSQEEKDEGIFASSIDAVQAESIDSSNEIEHQENAMTPEPVIDICTQSQETKVTQEPEDKDKGRREAVTGETKDNVIEGEPKLVCSEFSLTLCS
jgi:hypothetical protein